MFSFKFEKVSIQFEKVLFEFNKVVLFLIWL